LLTITYIILLNYWIYKDKPDIYLKSMERLGTNAEKTCIFEDSHIAICTADKMGIKTVGIYDKYNYGQDEIKKLQQYT